MSEQLQVKEQTKAVTFQDMALAALITKQASHVCRECGNAQGWEDWEIIGAPTFLTLMPPNQGGIPAVCMTCKKCGYIRTFALMWLGIQMEQRRIVTPDSPAFH